MIGETISHDEILEKLGEGGMGLCVRQHVRPLKNRRVASGLKQCRARPPARRFQRRGEAGPPPCRPPPAGDDARQILTTLDYEHAPLATANFIRIVEGHVEQAGGRGGRPPSGMGFGGRGGAEPPPIGTIVAVKGGLASAIVETETQKGVAISRLPKTRNKAIVHDAAGRDSPSACL